LPKRAFNPDGLPVPRGSYHQVAIAEPGRIVAIAGQTASDAEGNIVGEGDIKAQTREVLRKIKVGVEAAGGTMDDVVTMTVFITDARFYREVNDTRREVLGESFPTSTLVNVVSLARPGLLIEINALAVVPNPS
jgi:2-iminobutanoate/2-iminopropanoate deaminase